MDSFMQCSVATDLTVCVDASGEKPSYDYSGIKLDYAMENVNVVLTGA